MLGFLLFFLSLLYKDTSWSVDHEGENEVGEAFQPKTKL